MPSWLAKKKFRIKEVDELENLPHTQPVATELCITKKYFETRQLRRGATSQSVLRLSNMHTDHQQLRYYKTFLIMVL
jgi:hypothetical protein